MLLYFTRYRLINVFIYSDVLLRVSRTTVHSLRINTEKKVNLFVGKMKNTVSLRLRR